MCLFIHSFVYLFIYIYMYIRILYLFVYVFIYIYIYIKLFMYSLIYICIYLLIYLFIYELVYVIYLLFCILFICFLGGDRRDPFAWELLSSSKRRIRPPLARKGLKDFLDPISWGKKGKARSKPKHEPLNGTFRARVFQNEVTSTVLPHYAPSCRQGSVNLACHVCVKTSETRQNDTNPEACTCR